MRIEQIQYFLSAVETGSFTSAAQVCYVKPSSLAIGIQNLENELGGQLFVRSKSGVHLTSFGAQVLPKFTRINSLWNECKMLPKQSTQFLKLSFDAFSYHHYEYFLQNDFFLRSLPDIQILNDPHTIYENLNNNNIQAAFLTLPSDGCEIKTYKILLTRMEVIAVASFPIYAIFSSTHPLVHYTGELEFDQLRDYPIAAEEDILNYLIKFYFSNTTENISSTCILPNQQSFVSHKLFYNHSVYVDIETNNFNVKEFPNIQKRILKNMSINVILVSLNRNDDSSQFDKISSFLKTNA